MRKTWMGIQWLCVILLGLAGCKGSPPQIKAPKLVEEYTIPPSDDPRFSDPHYVYPKDVLNKDTIKKEAAGDPMTPGPAGGPSTNRFGAGAGAGPY